MIRFLFLGCLFTGALLNSLVLAGEFSFPVGSDWPEQVETLPPLLVDAQGQEIETAASWWRHRRYLKALVTEMHYGSMPERPSAEEVRFEISSREDVFDGLGERIFFVTTLLRRGKELPIRAVLLRPKKGANRAAIIKNDAILFDYNSITNAQKRAKYEEQDRLGTEAKVFREALRRGYGVCKFLREDVAGDTAPREDGGVFALYREDLTWGVIAAWAWAGSVIADVLVREFGIAPTRLIATGHSRGGKTALCQGIFDERIAVTVPSASGSGGTGSWRFFTEGGARQTPAAMERGPARWFTPRLYEFSECENRLPFDGHTFKALIAPRALLNTQGKEDRLANPVGTEATFRAAQAVFEVLGVPDHHGLHWRPGYHEQSEVDWLALLDFSDWKLFGKGGGRPFQQLITARP